VCGLGWPTGSGLAILTVPTLSARSALRADSGSRPLAECCNTPLGVVCVC